MKVPPQRKGNIHSITERIRDSTGLNESPSEKEGKSHGTVLRDDLDAASMKVPPKRKGNPGMITPTWTLPRTASMKVPPKRKGNVAKLRPHRICQ